MIEAEYKQFESELKSLVEVIDFRASISEAAMKRWWAALNPYPLNSVFRAMSQHEKLSKFIPKPADLIIILNNMDGRPSENEAWSIAIKSKDELETVVWTLETAEAFSVAYPILSIGDKQGAKMAFREKYNKLVLAARENLAAATWVVSLGHDKSNINSAIRRALDKKIISQQYANHYLVKKITREGRAIAGLLTGDVESENEITRKKLKEVRNAIQSKKSYSEKIRDKRKKTENRIKENFRKKKTEVEDYINSEIRN